MTQTPLSLVQLPDPSTTSQEVTEEQVTWKPQPEDTASDQTTGLSTGLTTCFVPQRNQEEKLGRDMEGQSLDKEPKGSHQPSSVSELDLTIIQRNRWKETFMYGTSLKRHLLTI